MNKPKDITSIGIDVAKAKLDVALMYADNSSVVETFPNSTEGISKCIRKLSKQKTACAVPCVLESTGLYHVNPALALYQAGYRVYVINPLITKKYQRSAIRNAKTDKIDALRLAEVGLKESNLALFSGDTKAIEVRRLVSFSGKLHGLKQQLRASLDSMRATATITGYTIDLISTEKALADLDDQLCTLEEKIVELAPQEARVLAEITPGLSVKNSAMVLGYLAGKNFVSRDQLVAFVGLDVMPRQSGSWTGAGRVSKRGNAYLRKVLYQIAWGLKQHNATFKKKYAELRARGLHYTSVLMTLARKFLRGLYAFYWQKYPQFTFDRSL